MTIQLIGGYMATKSYEESCREAALEIAQVVINKQHDYGHDNILAFREKGLVVRLWDKVARLKNLMWKNDYEPKNESVVDTFIDIGGYSIIALMLHKDTFKNELERNKKNGKDRD
tara:strand:- start:181 stop:525 length:345 start_codon:yes stop_codon:yes gene_type:complete